MTFRIFLSHSTSDREILDSIKSDLEKGKIEVYVAEDDPKPGFNLSDKVYRAIESCDAFVVLLTENGQSSGFVNSEIGIAKGAKKLIIPMLQIGVTLPTILSGVEYVKFEPSNITESTKSLRNFITGLVTIQLSGK